MTDIWDDETGEDSSLVKTLRKQIKELGQQVKDVTADRDKYKNSYRTSGVKDSLQKLGVKKLGIAKFIPEDIEPDEENIKAWLKENGELFGIDLEKETESQVGSAPTPQKAAEGFTAEQVDEMKKVQNLAPSSTETAPSNEDAMIAGLKSAFDQSTSFADFWNQAGKKLSRPS